MLKQNEKQKISPSFDVGNIFAAQARKVVKCIRISLETGHLNTREWKLF